MLLSDCFDDLDSLKQAISFAKAVQSDKWTAHEETKFRGEYTYDRAQIARLHAKITEGNRGWEWMFERSGTDVFALAYEDLISDEAGAILRLFDWLGLNVPRNLQLFNKYHRRQSNEINSEWERRYLEESAGAPQGS